MLILISFLKRHYLGRKCKRGEDGCFKSETKETLYVFLGDITGSQALQLHDISVVFIFLGGLL